MNAIASQGDYLEWKVGDTVFGKYRILRLLGRGAAGTVYHISEISSPEKVFALKLLSPKIANYKDTSKKFEQEIHISFRVSNPHVVRIHQFYRMSDTLAFTMEYVGESTLVTTIANQNTLGWDKVREILLQLTSGLKALHQAGILHCDLKPSNILLSLDGQLKISDFGSVFIRTKEDLVQKPAVAGTMDYLAPEYLERELFDHRSDLYALGIIAYELATGSFPFDRENSYHATQQKLEQNYRPAVSVNQKCPAYLNAIISKLLSADPKERYQNAEELELDLLAECFPKTVEEVEKPAQVGFSEAVRGDLSKVAPPMQLCEQKSIISKPWQVTESPRQRCENGIALVQNLDLRKTVSAGGNAALQEESSPLFKKALRVPQGRGLNQKASIFLPAIDYSFIELIAGCFNVKRVTKSIFTSDLPKGRNKRRLEIGWDTFGSDSLFQFLLIIAIIFVLVHQFGRYAIYGNRIQIETSPNLVVRGSHSVRNGAVDAFTFLSDLFRTDITRSLNTSAIDLSQIEGSYYSDEGNFSLAIEKDLSAGQLFIVNSAGVLGTESRTPVRLSIISGGASGTAVTNFGELYIRISRWGNVYGFISSPTSLGVSKISFTGTASTSGDSFQLNARVDFDGATRTYQIEFKKQSSESRRSLLHEE